MNYEVYHPDTISILKHLSFFLHNGPFFHTLFFAEGKKVKGLVRNDVFGDGVGRFMDFPSVRP